MIPSLFIRKERFILRKSKCPTVPDATMSLQEILSRINKNLPVPSQYLAPAIYGEEDNPLNNPRTDLSDFSDLLNIANSEVNSGKQIINEIASAALQHSEPSATPSPKIEE